MASKLIHVESLRIVGDCLMRLRKVFGNSEF